MSKLSYMQAALALPDVRASQAMQVFLSDMNDGTLMPNNGTEISLIEKMLGSVSELADRIDELMDGFRPTMFDAVVQQIIAAEDRSESMRTAGESAEARQGFFTEPLCDFLLELCQLKNKSDWLRRRAIEVVLQNLLGSTIERYVQHAYRSWLRQKMNHLLSTARLHRALDYVMQMLWPGGGPFRVQPRLERSVEEQLAALTHATQAMSILVPDIAEHVFGSERTRIGSQTLLLVIQNQRLNKHLLYTLLDQFLEELLPHPS